jgi:hypothetical protein
LVTSRKSDSGREAKTGILLRWLVDAVRLVTFLLGLASLTASEDSRCYLNRADAAARLVVLSVRGVSDSTITALPIRLIAHLNTAGTEQN